GYQTYSKALGSFVVGNNNDITDNPDPNNPLPLDRIFQIGNGNFSTTRSNALTVLRNANVGIGLTNPSSTLDVMRGTGGGGTAQFRGTQHVTHMNFGTNEDTYIRAGKDNQNVIINDIPGGKVGIGITDPSFMLDIGNRMRIRSGGGFSSAGLYLNNNDNSQLAAFFGMDDDTHVGFWGSGIGWRFTMNTNTGALKINGSEGQAGQVLRSNGSGSAPTWSNSPNTYYQFNCTDWQNDLNNIG